jgi:hypothetical protein
MPTGFRAFLRPKPTLLFYSLEYGYDHREPHGQSAFSGLRDSAFFFLVRL